MKSLFTLLLCSLVSLSLMGQHDTRDLRSQRSGKKHQESLSPLMNRISKEPGYARRHLLKDYRTIQDLHLKSVSADKQKMDSLYYEDYDTDGQEWILTGRDIYKYDSQGNMIQYVYDSLDPGTMELVHNIREDLTFDASGNIIVYLSLIWDESSGQWVNAMKWEDAFDGNDQLITEIYSFWDSEGSKWIPIWKDEYNYVDGNLTEVLSLFYYEDAQLWINDFRIKLTYDGNGNVTTELEEEWDILSDTWGNSYRYEYTYDAQGRNTVMVEAEWDDDTSTWINAWRYEYTYDAEGRNTVEVELKWDDGASQWVNNWKWEYTYNAEGRTTVEVDLNWDAGSSTWVNSWKYEYTYDQNGNMTEEVDYEWYSDQWNNDWKGVMVYDLQYTIQDLFVPYWFLGGQVYEYMVFNMPLSMTSYWPETEDWILWWRQTAFYSAFHPTHIGNAEDGLVRIYPNPASDYLTVSWESDQVLLHFVILDLAGKPVISRTIINNDRICINQIPQGIYLYKLTNKNQLIRAGKIILSTHQ